MRSVSETWVGSLVILMRSNSNWRLAVGGTLGVLVLGVAVLLVLQLRASSESAPQVRPPRAGITGSSSGMAGAPAPPRVPTDVQLPPVQAVPAPSASDPTVSAPQFPPRPASSRPAPSHRAPPHPTATTRHDSSEDHHHATGEHQEHDDSGDGTTVSGPEQDRLRRQLADSFCDRYKLPRSTCEQAAEDAAH